MEKISIIAKGAANKVTTFWNGKFKIVLLKIKRMIVL